jgi:ketopantoate reductase
MQWQTDNHMVGRGAFRTVSTPSTSGATSQLRVDQETMDTIPDTTMKSGDAVAGPGSLGDPYAARRAVRLKTEPYGVRSILPGGTSVSDSAQIPTDNTERIPTFTDPASGTEELAVDSESGGHDLQETELVPRGAESLEPQGVVGVDSAKGLPPDSPIYILGLFLPGQYLAHTLASSSAHPIRLLYRHSEWRRAWDEAGGHIVLARGDGYIREGNIQLERSNAFGQHSINRDPIEYLVITVPAGKIITSLVTIVHRLGRHSIICLINNGMGLIETINRTYFPDPTNQPLYVIGHMSHVLHDRPGQPFALVEKHGGRMWLAHPDPNFASRTDVDAQRISAFMRLFEQAPRLCASRSQTSTMLLHKMPSVAFGAIASSIAAVLNCTYGDIRYNGYARQVLQDGLAELSDIISAMPEFQTQTSAIQRRKLAWGGRLSSQVTKMLFRRRTWRSTTRMLKGDTSDVDYTLGWFVGQARRLGIRCPVCRTLLGQLKAKQEHEIVKPRSLAYWGDGSIPYLRASSMAAERAGSQWIPIDNLSSVEGRTEKQWPNPDETDSEPWPNEGM